MEITLLNTDHSVLEEIGRRLARLRLQRNLTQEELAKEAGISKRTLERMEAGESSTQLANTIRVLRALDLLPGIEQLIPEPGPSPMELLKNRGEERQRASSSGEEEPPPPSTWTWGDDP